MDFIVQKPLEIKRQVDTDFCLGCVISAIGEEYADEPCEEAYSFAAAKKVSGQPLEAYGVPAKAALMGAIRYGVLPKRMSPYGIASKDRDFLADWENWKDLEQYALKPFQSFYKVRDYEGTMLKEKTSLVIGLYWQSDWDDNPRIRWPNDTWNRLAPHEVRAIGMQDGRLVLQNSKGSERGDNGLWYMPPEAYSYINHAYRLSDRPWANKLSEFINKFL